MRENFLLLLPLLTPEYVVEAHFCLHRQTGEPLWEETDYEQRTLFEVVGVHDNIIALRGIASDQERRGLWRIDLREGEPIIPTYPDTFWRRRKQRSAQKNWWYMGDGYGLRGPINADGTVPTSSGLLDLKSLTLLHKNTFDTPVPQFTPLSRLTNTRRFDLPPFGTLRYRDDREPEDKIYEPNFHPDTSKIEQSFWLEDNTEKTLWNFDLAEATREKRPRRVEIHLRLPYLLILLFWLTDRYKEPIDYWKGPNSYDPGTYQIWVLDLRTGEVVQRLNPIEEGFVGNMECDDKGILFYANVRISGQHGCEFVYYPFSEPGKDVALGASGDR